MLNRSKTRRNFPAIRARRLPSSDKTKAIIIKIMLTLESISTINLTKTSDGTIRIGRTRIALESIVHHFSLGATAEEIAQKFPSLKLAEIYGVISYFLENHEEVAKYVMQQEAESNEIQDEFESKFQTPIAELRKRILIRWKHQQNALRS